MSREVIGQISFSESSYGYRHVSAWLGIMPEHDESGNRDLRYCGTAYSSDTEFYKVKITGQTDMECLRESREYIMYAEQISWDENFTLENAEIAIKALRKIRKYLDHAEEIAGRTTSFGQYLVRVYKAMKIRRVVLKIDGEYNSTTVDHAGMLVDKQIHAWRDKALEAYGAKA